MRVTIRKHGSMYAPLLGVLLLAACDAEAFGPGFDEHPSLRVYANVASVKVAALNIEVAAADISSSLTFDVPVSDGVASETVQVPTGSSRELTLRAFDADGLETHRGSRTVDIVNGSNPPVEVTLLPLQGGRHIDVTLGTIIVVVSTPVDTAMAGDSLQLVAAVIDSLGRTVTEAPLHWATLAPAIATVDSLGRVFGIAKGDARIVATYGDIGGSSVISVVEPADPGTVTDLSAAEVGSDDVTLWWTQVDDGLGEPASYAVRYGSPTIAWESAAGTEVSVGGTAIGDSISYTFSDLAPAAAHQFQLVAYRGTLSEGAVLGQQSNVAGASTLEAGPGEPASVIVTPAALALRGSGAIEQLHAEARDSDGTLIPDASFEWSSADSTIAIVTQEGLVTSQGFGTTVILATLLCGATACDVGSLTGSSDVTVAELERSERYPNEPAGFAPWFEHDWQTFPDDFCQVLPASGVGTMRSTCYAGSTLYENFTLVEDPTAPHGRGKSLRHIQPEGQLAGHSAGGFNLYSPKKGAAWNSTSFDDQVKLRAWYRSHWVMFEPDPVTGDWQFGDSHMRTFWQNRNLGNGHGNVGLQSPPSPRPPNRYDFYRGATMWHSDPSTIYFGDEVILPVGEWHHHEYLWERLGGFGEEGESRIRAWVNGILIMDEVITHNMMRPFGIDHFAMVWSGGGGAANPNVRIQDDFVRFGDIYISGAVLD
jgi:hypothetical protein